MTEKMKANWRNREDLAICPHCGRVFVTAPGGVCPHCSYPFVDILERVSVPKAPAAPAVRRRRNRRHLPLTSVVPSTSGR
ncbi:MAG: hypothetical protein HYU43_06340 [Armatimonadetes bacterium]|nr:hypothetical protein [Armatimonadota bacterium]